MSNEAIINESTSQRMLPAWIGSTLEWLGDRLNPILVKETRQSLKSRQFILWFLLLLVGCWLATIGAVLLIGPSIHYVSTGTIFLVVYFTILAFPLVIVVPFSAYRSLSAEQESNTRDLLEVSTLTPKKVVNGKLGSAMLQAMVYLSAIAPCVAFSYMLRGIGIGTISYLLLLVTLICFGLSCIGLFLAAISKDRRYQVGISVLFAGILFGSFFFLVAGVSSAGFSTGFNVDDEDFMAAMMVLFSLYASTLGLIYYATVGLITFVSANRSTPLRIAALVQQTVWVAFIACVLLYDAPLDVLYIGFTVGVIYWYLGGSLLSGETAAMSDRIKRTLPQSYFGRLFFTWLNPGPGSGYMFAAVNMTFLVILYYIGSYYLEVVRMSTADYWYGALLYVYAMTYLGIGRLIVMGLRKIAPLSMLGSFLVFLLIGLAGVGMPYMIDAVTTQLRIVNYMPLYISSPIWTLDRYLDNAYPLDKVIVTLIVVGSAASIFFMINCVLAAKEASTLRIARPKRVREDDQLLTAAPEQVTTNPWGDQSLPAVAEE